MIYATIVRGTLIPRRTVEISILLLVFILHRVCIIAFGHQLSNGNAGRSLVWVSLGESDCQDSVLHLRSDISRLCALRKTNTSTELSRPPFTNRVAFLILFGLLGGLTGDYKASVVYVDRHLVFLHTGKFESRSDGVGFKVFVDIHSWTEGFSHKLLAERVPRAAQAFGLSVACVAKELFAGVAGVVEKANKRHYR